MQIGPNCFPNQVKAYCYGMAAQSAMAMGSNSISINYAEKAVKTDSAARNFLILWNCEMSLGFEYLKNKNFELGLAHSVKGMDAYESAKNASSYIVGYMVVTNANGSKEEKIGGEVDMVPASQVSRMYFVSSLAAFEMSSNRLGREYLKKAIVADPSNSSAMDLDQKIKLGVN